MRHKDTVALYDYWNEMRGDAPAPLRSRIAPAGLGQLLPSVMLLDKTDADDFIFRIAGSRLCSLRCGELKTKPFASIFMPEDRQGLTRIINSVDRGNSVVILDTLAKRPGGSGVSFEIGLFSARRRPDAHYRCRIRVLVAGVAGHDSRDAGIAWSPPYESGRGPCLSAKSSFDPDPAAQE